MKGCARCGRLAPLQRAALPCRRPRQRHELTPRHALPRPSCPKRTTLQGSQLEPRLGPLPFLRLIAELAAVSSAVYLGGTLCLLRCGGAAGAYGAALWRTCVVGFSGVLFGLKARGTPACSLSPALPPSFPATLALRAPARARRGAGACSALVSPRSSVCLTPAR